LAKPVYHGGFIEFINKVLRCVCYQCSKILLDKERHAEIMKIKSQTGRFTRVSKYCDPIHECKQQSGGCGLRKPKYTKVGLGIEIEYKDERFD
jgi:DNA-directed RNA polymerase II subunit RPB1